MHVIDESFRQPFGGCYDEKCLLDVTLNIAEITYEHFIVFS